MKRSIGLFGVAVAVLGSLCWAGDFKTNVGVTKTLLLGSPVYTRSITAWAAAITNVVGEYVMIGGRPFVCIATNSVGLTGATEPGPGNGTDIVDNQVTWRPVMSKKRTVLVIGNRGASAITLGLHGTLAGVGTGVVLSASSMIALSGEECPQSSVWVISAAGTTNEVGGCEE